MLPRSFLKIKNLWFNFESNFLSLLFGHIPPGCHPEIAIERAQPFLYDHAETEVSSSFDDFLRSSFLFAVPKSRRTLEKRRNRKFGWPQWVWKPIVPRTNILICNNCGHDYEAGHLCGFCYKQVQLETEEMQKVIEAELQLNPIDKEVIVLYEGEAQGKPEAYWQGKRIVEMKKQRPAWFSDNLLQRSTADNTPPKEDKPKDLA